MIGGAVAASDVSKVRTLLEKTVREHPADAILLSAGLDTSIIAVLMAEAGHRPLGVTVCWDDSAPDLPYARELAERLGLEHHVVITGAEGLLEAIPPTVQALRSFDPMEIRNDLVQFIGLRTVAALGGRSCLVGDAADELFAGYSYMVAMEPDRLDEYTRELARFMKFAAGRLGSALDVEVVSPFLDPSIVELAVALPATSKVGERDGVRHGKLHLREAFEVLLGERHAWRVKTPAEEGSGSARLRQVAEERITDEAWEAIRNAASQDGILLREREQGLYWPAFREAFGRPSNLDPALDTRCPQCRGPLRDNRARYCPTCGAWPVG
ncbi:MAG: asparagine synthase-related protein [Candidatus Dormibacteraceae bacterium]